MTPATAAWFSTAILPTTATLDGFFGWLARSSAQASVLVCLILLAQWVLRERLTPRWRHALWLLVVVRLALPSAPESRLSVFNLFAPSGNGASGVVGSSSAIRQGLSESAIKALGEESGKPGTHVAIEGFEIRPYEEGGLHCLVLNLRNRGETTLANKFKVLFYRGDPDRGGELVHKGGYDQAGPLAPGEKEGVSCLPFALKEGGDEFVVLVDPENRVLGPGEGDRRAELKVIVKNGKIVANSVPSDAGSTGKWTRPAYVSETSTLDSEGRIVDKIDYPFVDDPGAIGTWRSVDFVADPKEFRPGRQQWEGDLYLKELVFLPDGKTATPWWTWTKGSILDSADRTASQYVLKEIDGAAYMFFEWKSGDYSIRHDKPHYYVLKKVSGAP